MTLAIDSALATSSRRTISLPTTPSAQGAGATTTAPRPTVQDSVAAPTSGGVPTSDSLAHAVSIADTAQAAAGSVLQILQQLKATAASASAPDVSDAARSDLSTAFKTLVGQLGAAVQGASTSGVNLIDGSALPAVVVAADGNGGQARLTAYDLTPGGPTVSLSPEASVQTAGSAASALGQVQSALESTSGVLSNLATEAKQIGVHADFVARLGAALGAAEPDGADGVRLQALQLRQDLSQQGAGIANAAPRAVLSLFRA